MQTALPGHMLLPPDEHGGNTGDTLEGAAVDAVVVASVMLAAVALSPAAPWAVVVSWWPPSVAGVVQPLVAPEF